MAFAEVEPYPCAVLAHRFPDVPNLGNVEEVDWKEFKERHGAVDLVVGGSPCQSFSVAGKREGLRGASRLMYEYIRCVQELMPSWFTWENVPGSLTVERGGAFRQLLDSMDVLGYGLAWRVLDAQFFGVAQRRRRLFLVGHLGDRRACEVLLESEGMQGNSQTSKAKREELARANGGSSPTHSRSGEGVLTMSSGQANAEITTDNISPTLTCLHEVPIVFDRAAFNQGGGRRNTCRT